MLKKTVKYIDFDNVEQEDVLYFNITQAELTEMELSSVGNNIRMSKHIQAIIDAKREDEIYRLIKDIVLASYGERDGKNFKKSKEISELFSHTEAFSALLSELTASAEAAAEFFNGIIPKFVNPPPNNN